MELENLSAVQKYAGSRFSHATPKHCLARKLFSFLQISLNAEQEAVYVVIRVSQTEVIG